MPIIIIIVRTNTFFKNNPYLLFIYTFTNMNKFGNITWKGRNKLIHATEVLKIDVLTPLLYN